MGYKMGYRKNVVGYSYLGIYSSNYTPIKIAEDSLCIVYYRRRRMGRMSNRVNRNGYHIRYQIVWEELSISNDFLFGKVMQDPELCRELLQRILPDLDIDHIEYPELTIRA